MVSVDVEYIVKSTKTNERLFARRGDINYNTTVQVQNAGGTYGALIAAVGSMVQRQLQQLHQNMLILPESLILIR
jgi:hypothetical protein